MEWLKDLIKAKPLLALFFPTGLGAINFLANLFTALSNGEIDSNELHQMMSGASSVQTIILLIIMIAFKAHNDQKPKD